MKLTSMQKMLAVIALIAVAVIAAVLLLIVPKFGELGKLDSDLQAAKDQVAQTQALVAQLEQARSTAAMTQAELLALGNQMPENPELPSLLIELQDASNAAGVRFDRVSPGEPVSVAGVGYTEIPLTVEISGRWADLLDYMRRINTMTRAIRVSDVALTPVAASTSTTEVVEPEVKGGLTMRAYVMSAPSAQVAPPALPAPATQP
jgi:type IV pilus assembly protein PilO